MKSKLSITVEQDLISKLESIVKQGIFRNKSHIVEFALNKLLRENGK